MSLPIYAQSSGQLSTAQVQQAMQRPGGVTFDTRLTKLKQDTLMVDTLDGKLQLGTHIQPKGRFLDLPARITVEAHNDLPPTIIRIDALINAGWHANPLAYKTKYPELSAAQDRLRQATSATMMSENQADFQRAKSAAQDVEDEILAAYRSAPMSRQESRRLVEAYKENAVLRQRTFRQDYNERYPPAAYQRIFDNTRGALALQLKGADLPQCSGVLVAKRTALTNRHCVSEYLPEQLEVIFDYEADLDGNLTTRRVFPVSDIKFRDTEEYLDFAVLELGESEGRLPGDIYPVQCLSTTPVKRGDAIYLVGYPLGEPRVVHDNTHVYFPFWVDEAGHSRIEVEVRAEFAKGPEEDQAYRDGKIREFLDAYQKKTDRQGKVYFEYFSARFRDQPTIGADSDTYEGNSGSPAFHRRSHAVVGLLFDGYDNTDASAPWSPGWRRHEAILPATAILAAINANESTWASSIGLCIVK